MRTFPRRIMALCVALVGVAGLAVHTSGATPANGRFLYVATPGIRNYLEYGGHGVLVYDIDHGHKLLRRIKAAGLDEKGEPLTIKGICASAVSKKFYVTTTRTLTCFDLLNEKILWEKGYEGGCDRMSISPD